jgi:small subunit ribosomal protein S1
MIIEEDTEQMPAEEDMGQLLDQMGEMKSARRGDIVEGVIMRADPSDGLFVNIGQKSEAHVPANEMRTVETDDITSLAGGSIIAMVVRPESGDNPAILSVDRAVGEQGWRSLEKTMESGEVIEGKIAGFNRGGSIVEVEGVQGFVPMSQLVSVPRERFRLYQEEGSNLSAEEQQSIQDAQSAELGRDIQVKVLEVNRSRNRAIFSERQAVQESRDALKARLIAELTEGEVRMGRVTGISKLSVS